MSESQKQYMRHVHFKNRAATVGQLMETLNAYPRDAVVMISIYDTPEQDEQPAGESFIEDLNYYPDTGCISLSGSDPVLMTDRGLTLDAIEEDAEPEEEEEASGDPVVKHILESLARQYPNAEVPPYRGYKEADPIDPKCVEVIGVAAA